MYKTKLEPHTVRGKQVMLDSDLAIIYGYEVKRLNEQVKYKSKEQIASTCIYRAGNIYVSDCIKW